MKMEQTECSETSAYKIQTPGNYPEENIKHTEQGESLKSRICLIEIRNSVHHLMNQINQPTRCRSLTSLLLDVYVWFNMFRAPPRPSSGAYNCVSSLWFYRWSVAVAALLVVGGQVKRDNLPDHDQQRCYCHAPTVKTRGLLTQL